LTAGDPLFTSFAMILEDQRPLDGPAVLLSPSVQDAEWDQRAALNDLLLHGDGSDAYAKRLRALEPTLAWGPWARDRDIRARWMAGRIALRESFAADLDAALARYPVRYLALTADRDPPRLGREAWVIFRRDGRWTVWERRDASAAAKGAPG
jgi:hypothetical protein